MKKLMIAVVAVAMAAATQAATYGWKWTSTLADPLESSYSGTVYVFNGQDVKQSTILSAIQAGTASITDYTAIDSRSTTDGKGSTSKPIAESQIGTLTTDGGGHDAVDYFYAAIFKDTVSGKDYLFLTETYQVPVEASQETTLTKALSSAQVTDSKTFVAGKNWYDVTQAVPEPTSGLLLLLGVAGLALRRRRA